MKKLFRSTLVLSLLAALALSSGCAYKDSEYRSTEAGALGIFRVKTEDYTNPSPASIQVSTDEIIPQSLPSGNKAKLFCNFKFKF